MFSFELIKLPVQFLEHILQLKTHQKSQVKSMSEETWKPSRTLTDG